MKSHFLIFPLLFLCTTLFGQDVLYHQQNNIVYSPNKDSYSKENCKLDFYYPTNLKDYTTIIWFHGGGLTSGQKDIPKYLLNNNIAILGIGYRFSPKVTVKEVIEDAADAVKWTVDHIEKYGGNKNKIIIGGYSAGGYLALMLALDSNYLHKHNLNPNQFLGIAALSGQAITHFTSRQERGIPEYQPLIDSLAPLYWVRKDIPNTLLITGDRELERLGRYEENAYLYRMLKLVGNKNIELLELDGYGHDMQYPAFPILLKKIKEWTK